MNAEQVKQLQRELNAKGANLKVDGILGPKTQAAMQQFSAGVTQPGASMTTAQVMELQKALNAQGANLKVDGILGPKTTAAMNAAVSNSLANNKESQYLTVQNSPDAIVNAYMTGDWSGITDVSGVPFSREIQEQAVKDAESALAPAFKAEKAYDTANVEDALAADVADYGGFLRSEARDFADQKNNLDQNSADRGVLFSGSRYQKENDLKTIFAEREAAKRNQVARDITSTARDFQYQYGNPAAGSLSDYYQLPGQTYNPHVASGKVTPSSLSSVYNVGRNDFQGTKVNANKAAVQTRAAGILANRTNKLVPYGYKNQF